MIENYIFQHLSTVSAVRAQVEFPVMDSNMLSNPSFDAVITGWSGENGTAASSHPAGGGQSDDYGIITSTGGATQSLYQNVTLVSGYSYRVGCYVKLGTSTDTSFVLSMIDVSAGTTMGSVTGVATSSWVYYTFDFTATDTDGRIKLTKNSTHAASPGTMLFDTVTLYRILSTNVKIYPMRAPQDPNYPYIVYQRISTNPEYHLSGFSSMSNITVQFDMYATSHAGIRTLSSAIHTAMQTATFVNYLENDMDFVEPDLDAYRVVQDYSIWVQE